MQMSEDTGDIIVCLRNGTAIGVSDGSFKEEFGTASWVLENADGTQRIQGLLITPGFHSDQSAYRSEISGLYAMVTVIDSICKVWDLQQGGITLEHQPS